jgi:hypothetical protein
MSKALRVVVALSVTLLLLTALVALAAAVHGSGVAVAQDNVYNTLRVYGHEHYGAGDPSEVDPETGRSPEDPPYTWPEPIFNPQLDQAPVKDSITWNPLWMSEFETFDENHAHGLYNRIFAGARNATEKVWFRMWYEPWHWDKDLNANDELDIHPEAEVPYTDTLHDEWYPAVMQEFTYMLMEADLLENEPQPLAGQVGRTTFVFPVGMRKEDLFTSAGAVDEDSPNARYGYGLTSLDGDFDGVPDIVHVESELTLFDKTRIAADFDGDGLIEPLDVDPIQLNGNELAIFRLDTKPLAVDQAVQFLDHLIIVKSVFNDSALLEVWYTGDMTPVYLGNKTIFVGDMLLSGSSGPGQHIRALDNGGPGTNVCDFPTGAFFVYLDSIDQGEDKARLMVGRALGATWSAMEDAAFQSDRRPGDPWFLKRFYVDGHEYNVVAIKTEEGTGGVVLAPGCTLVPSDWPPDVDPTLFKFITIRTPIPKEGTYDDPLTGYLIEQHSVRLQPYAETNELSVMPPYNYEHYAILDVQAIDGFTCDEDDVYYFGPLVGPVPPILQQNGPFPYQGVGPYSPYNDRREMSLFYVEEDKNWQFLGVLKEMFREAVEEFWYGEQFHTLPWEYTEFVLPDLNPAHIGGHVDLYLLTSAFVAPQSEYVLWTQDVPTDTTSTYNLSWDPDTECWVRDEAVNTMPDPWSPRVKFWFDPAVGGKKYKDDRGLRLYGFDSEGPGAAVPDPVAPAYPVEVRPYTDTLAPFNPRLTQAPPKDSLTFNPAYMNEFNHGNESLVSLYRQISIREQNAYEKVFLRMWYEPEYLDKILEWDPLDPTPPFTSTTVYTFPAVMQEFTYMYLNTADQPASAQPKSSAFAFPMATAAGQLPAPDTSTGNLPTPLQSFGWGVTTFDANFDGQHDIVQVHSENSLAGLTSISADFDGDGGLDLLDTDALPLSGDEMVVFALEDMDLQRGQSVQFLDHMVTLENVSEDRADLKLWYTGGGLHAVSGGYSLHPDRIGSYSLRVQEMAIANRSTARVLPAGGGNLGALDGAWFVFVNDINSSSERVSLVVGRALGHTHSAMDDGAGGHDLMHGDPWYLKRFFVDGHEYNVVALHIVPATTINPGDEAFEFKYITIRTPVPKVNFINYEDSQKLEGYYVGTVWGVNTSVISVMPPFNFPHTGMEDVQALEEKDPVSGKFIFEDDDFTDDDCHGRVLKSKPAYEIRIVDEDTEPQFSGELKEKYYEDGADELWQTEQWRMVPDQYTELRLPVGQLYLLTSNWRSDQNHLYYYYYDCQQNSLAPVQGMLLGAGPEVGALAAWPDCGFNCSAGDVTIDAAWLGDASGSAIPACTLGDSVAGFIWIDANNGTGTNRYAPWLLYDLYINGTLNGTITPTVNTCVDDVLPPGPNLYFVDPLVWTCGDELELRNVVISWDTTPGTDCGDAPTCAGRKAHSWCSDAISVTVPIASDGLLRGGPRVQFLYDPQDTKDVYVNTWQGPGPQPTPTPTPSPTPPPGGTGTITGKVKLQGRTNHIGAEVQAGGVSTFSDSSGHYSLSGVPVGTHDVVAEMAGYLDHVKSAAVLTSDAILVLPDVLLLGGDANNDCMVNVFDLVIVGWNYGTMPPSDLRADMNGNGMVDIFDLVMVGVNLDQSCPGPWVTPSMAGLQAVQPAHLRVSPVDQEVQVGDVFTVTLELEDVSNLYGADAELRFETSILEVVDADPVRPGVQVTKGTFPDPAQGTVPAWEADNVAGTARYAIGLESPAQPAEGSGTLCAITFRAKAAGTSALTIHSASLSDQNADPIEVRTHDGSVGVTSHNVVYLPVVFKSGRLR